MRSVRKISALALLVLGVSAVAPGGAPASAQPTAAQPATTPKVAAQPRTVTLLTGDTVHLGTVNGQTTVDVVPGKGRERIPFLAHSAGKDVRVIPADAVGLLNRGKLDARLFDISKLVEFGYDDTRATLPLIVQHGSGAAAGLAGARTTRQLSGASAVAENRADAVSFWNNVTSAGSGTERQLRAGFDKIWLDGLRHPTLDVSVPLTGAPKAWQAGWTGAGVKVGVIDTGVDQTHPDLAGRVAAAENFSPDPDALDRVGHGTHVASTIAGTAAASQGRYQGMAPGATLYSAKVCMAEGCPESAILAGMTWVAEQGVKVANMSLGGQDDPEIDPIEAALTDLTSRYGVLFVVAAGNTGMAGDSTVNSPGGVAEALTVGAVSKTGELAEFSSRGPRTGDAGIKPDITAPGVGIVAARSSTSDLWPNDENPQYASLSGTSMATPHVAGAAAILAQQHPDWTPERIKSTLMAAAQPNAGIGVYEQGAGFLDVARAIQQTVTASPVSAAFERTTAAQQRTVTYTNSGSSALTLAVSLDAKDADGAPAPAGLFSLSASSVTVPAGGTATVTVTVQAGADLPDRYFGGEVTATSGGVQVQTPVALDIARHQLSLKLVGPDGGAPTPEQGWVTVLTDLDRQTMLVLGDPATTRYRVRAGRYLVQTYLVSGDPFLPHVTTLVRPSLDLTTDQALTMDARLAKPIAVSVPNSKATAVHQEFGWTIRTEQPQIWGSNDLYGVLMNIPFEYLRTAQIGAGETPGFVSYVNGMWGQVAQDGSLHNSPYAYRVYLYEPQKMMTGLTRKLGAGDFATVRSQISADVAGVPVARTAVAHAPGNSPIYRDERSVPPSFSYDVPSTITEYYNQDKQAVWQSTSAQLRYTYYQSPWTSFQPGRTYTVKWANAVAGPVFPEPNFGQQFATRYWGDLIGGPGPLHGDGTGHMGFRHVRGGSVEVNLYRNGVKVGDANQAPWVWEVPAEPGDYRLAATFRSDPAFTLSTVVDAEWTFKSGHVGDGELVKLPMTAIRYTPELNINNRAPANRLFAIPVSLDRQVGAAPGQTTALTVEASFDDGKTWRQLTVQRSGEQAVAWVHNPAGTGFVSLRAAATDTSGNTVKQTVIRAYRY
ncbi:Serine protease, subtilisin family [Micromonospora purpureochromogenes]|uniref:Serine protease, subtilisin family n=1 Tax=Micromonospora purpureochromogenes TaxID=47872 RepID=A0A1C4ZQF9_9ACTN|nr:S8 family serine peptidase [Micromonospora purpureochromogenes]SCF35218.1 Serine protease, subtilisin family [Micromonospora purpureochromogenes]